MKKTPNKSIGRGMKAWMLILAAVPVIVLTLRSRSHSDQALQPQELAALLKAKDTIALIDVRSPEEYAGGHIAGAKLIPLSELGGRIAEIPRDKPVVFYCRSGHRSGNALDVVKDAGLMLPRHLGGGILAWTGAGLPTTR